MDNEKIRAIEKAARYANNPWPSNGEVRSFRDIATPAVVLELISLTRATEAKPSASAAPGIIDIKTWRQRYEDGECRSAGDAMDATDNELRAAIAAAREEGRVAAAIEMGKADGHQRAADVIDTLRARLAAPEGYVLVGYINASSADWLREAEAEGISTSMRVYGSANEARQINVPVFQLQPQAKAPQQLPAGEDVVLKDAVKTLEYIRSLRGAGDVSTDCIDAADSALDRIAALAYTPK